MQGRGLKPCVAVIMFRERRVAPYAGAWIETEEKRGNKGLVKVAPYAGAWIETTVLFEE